MDETRTAEVDPRTGLADIDEATCWELLSQHGVGRLAVVVGTVPDIFPVNYVVDGRRIVVRTEGGTKLAAAVLHGSVAFEIDEIDEDAHVGWSVVVAGRAREPRTLEEVVEIDDLGVTPWAQVPKTRYVVIEPDRVTGRRLPGSDVGA